MTGITVTFENDQEDAFPIEVEHIGEHLFEVAGGNLTEMDADDRAEFKKFLRTVSADDAIIEAQEIVFSAPAFDSVDVDVLDLPGTTATVTMTGL